MSKNLFDIQDDYNSILLELENHCIENNTDEIPEDLLAKLQISESELGDKLDAYHHKILEIQAEEKALGEYIKKLQTKKKALANSVSRIKGYAGVAIEQFGTVTKSGTYNVKTKLHSVTAKRSVKLVIEDESLIPADYVSKEMVEQVTIDKKNLKLDMQGEGDTYIAGAYLDKSNIGVTFR